ncbi:MAG: o-succinylbenzoate synthase [Flavobacteriales bacterium]
MDDQKNVKFIEQIKFELVPYQLNFRRPAKTSRDTLVVREIYFLKAYFLSNPTKFGLGECSPIYGLSPEIKSEVVGQIQEIANRVESDNVIDLEQIKRPAIKFAFESAILDLLNGGERIIFPTFKKQNIPINGLVWMNGKTPMMEEAFEKIGQGYKVIKLKIGGIDFEEELSIIKKIRESNEKITIRLDANGSFRNDEALDKLKQLAVFNIHSIEQPIQANQWDEMKMICENSPIPVALDEELIGVNSRAQKMELLESIHPQYIILKPSLHGGLSGCDEWIQLAESMNINWWATSMLESSVGLNVIAQWLSTKNVNLEQGLGTGGLYLNNLPAAWSSENGALHFDGLESLKAYQF